MTKLNESERGLHLSNILDKKLGKLRDWTAPKIMNSTGPFNPEIFDQFDTRRREVVEACEAKLAAYSNDQIDELVFSDPISPNRIERDWKNFMRAEIDKLGKSEPPWYAAGFGHPDYIADFSYWAQTSYFSDHEALFLSLGVEPKHFDENQVEKISQRVARGDNLWPTLHYMLRRREQMSRQFPRYSTHGQISPKELFRWFALVELEVHPLFTSRYPIASNEQLQDKSQEDLPPKRPHKRELDTIAQLFTVMAIECYGYRPDEARSPTPREIVDSAAKIGVQISDDTVRKYLRLGASFIPPDWNPEDV